MADITTPLTVSASPHAHSGASVRGIMLTVVAALLPALLWGFWLFGWPAIRLTLVCGAACIAAEALSRHWMRRASTVGDVSALVTGILLAMNLPPTLPVPMAALGAFVAIILAKQVFGGLGYNPFNPALVARVFLLISFPAAMTRWIGPTPPLGMGSVADAVSAATPLGEWKTAWSTGAAPVDFFDRFPAIDLFFGQQAGCMGEVSALLLLLGGLFLLWRRCINWQTPVAFIATVTVIAAILWGVDSERFLPPWHHLFSGGLMLGAWFMATDMVTSPVTRRGMLIFGAGCGLLTMLIRVWGGYPEGVSFAILLMNATVPLINRSTRPTVFGTANAS